jgi:hypothetical protein
MGRVSMPRKPSWLRLPGICTERAVGRKRTKILDEFVAVTLSPEARNPAAAAKDRQWRWGGAVHPLTVWLEAAEVDHCALLPALERHAQLAIDEFSGVRVVARGGRRRSAGFSSAIRADDWATFFVRLSCACWLDDGECNLER